MRTYKYKFQHQRNLYYLRQILDDLFEISQHFYRLRQRHYRIYGKNPDGSRKKDYDRPTYVDFGKHFTKFKKRTKPHWNIVPVMAVTDELIRQDKALVRFLKKISGYPKIKRRNSFKSFSLPSQEKHLPGIQGANWKIENNRIRIGFREWSEEKEKFINSFGSKTARFSLRIQNR